MLQCIYLSELKIPLSLSLNPSAFVKLAERTCLLFSLFAAFSSSDNFTAFPPPPVERQCLELRRDEGLHTATGVKSTFWQHDARYIDVLCCSCCFGIRVLDNITLPSTACGIVLALQCRCRTGSDHRRLIGLRCYISYGRQQC